LLWNSASNLSAEASALKFGLKILPYNSATHLKIKFQSGVLSAILAENFIAPNQNFKGKIGKI